MAYIVTRNNRFYVVSYDGIDPTTGKERRRWQLAGTSRADAEAIAESLTEAPGARIALGRDAVTWIDAPSMGGEDFAFYQQQIPGVFVRLGAAMDDQDARQPLHSSHFDINESALPIGVRFMLRAGLHLASTYHASDATGSPA